MKRRAFLLMAGAGLLGSAGCLGASNGGDRNTSQQTTEQSPTPRMESTAAPRRSNTTIGEPTHSPAEPRFSATKSTESPTTYTDTQQNTYSPANSSTTGFEQSQTEQTPIETETMSLVGQAEGASWSAEENPQVTGRIGSRSHLEEGDIPHSIQIWNDASTTRTIHLSLIPDGNPKQPVFEKTYRLNPDSYVSLELMISDDFVAKVGVNTERIRPVAEISSDSVDCNESTTYIAVRSDGAFDWSYFTTQELCANERNRTTTNGTVD